MYRLKLSDGSVIDGLKCDGQNFISEKEITSSAFEDKLDGVTIEYTGNEKDIKDMPPCGYHEHMKLIYCKKIPFESGIYIMLEDVSESELRDMRLNARLEYLEMMIGTGEEDE